MPPLFQGRRADTPRRTESILDHLVPPLHLDRSALRETSGLFRQASPLATPALCAAQLPKSLLVTRLSRFRLQPNRHSSFVPQPAAGWPRLVFGRTQTTSPVQTQYSKPNPAF